MKHISWWSKGYFMSARAFNTRAALRYETDAVKFRWQSPLFAISWGLYLVEWDDLAASRQKLLLRPCCFWFPQVHFLFLFISHFGPRRKKLLKILAAFNVSDTGSMSWFLDSYFSGYHPCKKSVSPNHTGVLEPAGKAELSMHLKQRQHISHVFTSAHLVCCP